MPGVWRDGDLDFDTAAKILVDAHARDGRRHDLPRSTSGPGRSCR
jgi:hypothetical protein